MQRLTEATSPGRDAEQGPEPKAWAVLIDKKRADPKTRPPLQATPLELDPCGGRKAAAERIVGRREGIAAVLRRRADCVPDERRLLVEQVEDRKRQREMLIHVESRGEVEIVLRADLSERGIDHATSRVCSKRVGAVPGSRLSGGQFVRELLRLELHLPDVSPEERQIDASQRQRGSLVERIFRQQAARRESAVRTVEADALTVEGCWRRLELLTVRVIAAEVEAELRWRTHDRAQRAAIIEREVNAVGSQLACVGKLGA